MELRGGGELPNFELLGVARGGPEWALPCAGNGGPGLAGRRMGGVAPSCRKSSAGGRLPGRATLTAAEGA